MPHQRRRTRAGHRSRRATIAAPLVVIALMASACGDDTTTPDPTTAGGQLPLVVTTTAIWGDVVENLTCGGQAEVQTLIPRGADAHAYEPSLADRERMDGAQLVVANGLGLEASLDDTIGAVAEAGTPVFRVGDHVAQLADPAAPDRRDPHIWLDPVRVGDALPALADALVASGLEASAVTSCLEEYQGALTDRHADMEAKLGAIPAGHRVLVSNHDSLGYFADRYGLEVVGTVIPSTSTLAEPNPRELDELADTIAELQVPAIFTETQESARDAQALADRIGSVTVVALPTGNLGEPDSDAGTYLGLLDRTATLVADALG